MKVFVTGATGWVGGAVVKALVAHGHQVTGLSRSEEKAPALTALGAVALRGTLDDHDLLKAAVGDADAVAHLAFNHDFSNMAANGVQERRAVEAMGEALKGTDKPILVTSGVGLLAPGRMATEADRAPADPDWPRKSEAAAEDLARQGVRAAVVRLAPSVHGLGEHGFLTILAGLARQTGVSAYLGDGANRWTGVHRDDAAAVYRLALERGAPEPVYHVTAEDGVPFREIATAIGKALGLPVESRSPEHFGWFARFAGADMPASSQHTRAALGWEPTGPGLLEDVGHPGYFDQATARG